MKNEYTAEQVEAMAADLRDAPGTSMLGTHISVSTGKAVAMYEVLTAYAAALRQQVEQDGGVVSRDLLAIACQARNKESERARKAGLPRNETAELRAALEAVAPLLRAPAEQGGRVDEEMSIDLALGYAKAACIGPMSSQAIAVIESALAQNAQGEAWGYIGPREQGTMQDMGYAQVLDKPLPQMNITTPVYIRADRARVPDGWVLVPREPTPEMIDACIAAWQQRLRRKAQDGTLLCGGNAEKSFRENWTAMLNATPDRSIECTVAVAWQHRHTGYPDEWKECTREEFDYTKKQPDCPREGRALYAHAERVRVPQPIIELDECRKVGWNDSAPAYRAGWNACRDAMLAAAPSQPEDAA